MAFLACVCPHTTRGGMIRTLGRAGRVRIVHSCRVCILAPDVTGGAHDFPLCKNLRSRRRARAARSSRAAARAHRRVLPGRRGRDPVGADRRSPPRAAGARPGAGGGDDAGRGGARGAFQRRRRRRADARVLAGQPRRHRADVPGRSAAAHSRRRDARPADPGQDQPRRLVGARRGVAVAVRERGGVGSARHREDRRDAQRGNARAGDVLAAAQGRRAADPQGRGPRDAPARPPVRHRAHDRRGAGQRPRPRGARLHVLVRHAGRGGDDGRRRPALLRRVRRRDPRDRPRGEWPGRVWRAGHLDEALGAASALLPRAARAGAGRADAEAHHAGAPREGLRHRVRDRRRGGRPSRDFARPPGPAGGRTCAGRLGRARLRRPVLPEAGATHDRLDRRARAAAPAAPDAAARQGRLLGRRDQARRSRRAARVPRVHAQGALRRRLPRVREGDARGSRRDLSAVRQPQCVHHCRGPRAGRRRGSTSSSACTAWARASTTRSSGRPSSIARAASTRPSARTRRCSPTWCGGCSRTAPTARSSTGSSIRRLPSRRWSPTRSPSPRRAEAGRMPAFRCRSRCCRAAAIRRASTLPTTGSSRRWKRGLRNGTEFRCAPSRRACRPPRRR